jgi:ribonuclease-3
VVARGLGEAERLGIRDPKSALQEHVQAAGEPAPWYRVVSTRGPQHEQIFEVEVVVGGNVCARGEGRSKRLAERAAAMAALAAMRETVSAVQNVESVDAEPSNDGSDGAA